MPVQAALRKRRGEQQVGPLGCAGRLAASPRIATDRTGLTCYGLSPADQHEASEAFFHAFSADERNPQWLTRTNSLRAKRAAVAKMAFYVHLAVHLLVNALLIAINLLTSAGLLWFQWPLIRSLESRIEGMSLF